MHALEDALAVAQAMSTSDPHPLLSAAERAKIEHDTAQEASRGGDSAPFAGAQGTLLVEAGGVSRFFGPSGASEVGERLEGKRDKKNCVGNVFG